MNTRIYTDDGGRVTFRGVPERSMCFGLEGREGTDLMGNRAFVVLSHITRIEEVGE